MRIAPAWAFVAFLASPAFAADLPTYYPSPAAGAPASYDWTGFYIAGNVGWGSTNATVTDTFTAPGFGLIGTPVTTAERLRGTIGGVGAGYNWQFDRLVLGIEADFDISREKYDEPSICNAAGVLIPGCTVSTLDQMQWFTTLRGRAGIALDRLLVYGTGGLAVENLHSGAAVTVSGAGNWDVFDVSNTRTGYAVGGGVETIVAAHWIVGAEYLHINTGTRTTANVPLPATLAQTIGAPPGTNVEETHGLGESLGRLLIGYRF